MPPNFRNNNQSSNHISNNGSNEYNNSGNQRFGGGNNNNGSSANPAKNNNSGGGNYSQQKFAAHSAAKATDNDQLQVKADVNSGGKQRTSGKMYNSGSCGGATNQSGLLLVRGMNQQIHGMNQQQYGGNGTAINVSLLRRTMSLLTKQKLLGKHQKRLYDVRFVDRNLRKFFKFSLLCGRVLSSYA